jgi:3-dehydroquinate synthase
LLHGEAIVAGMILESYISLDQKLISESEYAEIKSTLNNIFDKIIIDENEQENIIELLIHDKKNEYGKVQFALLDGIGKIKINQATDNETIIAAFLDYKN